MADDRKPGDPDGPQDEPFLQRWARRKSVAADTATDEAPLIAPAVDAASLQHAPPAPATGEPHENTEIDLSTLPDIDSMDAESDFSVFMQNGIPEALQKRALQKLWRLDPAFGHIDGLLEYGEDYTGNGLVAEAVNTIYKVGKGMVSDEEEAEAEAEAEAKSQANEEAGEEDAASDDDAPALAITDGTDDSGGNVPQQSDTNDTAPSGDSVPVKTV